jgi:hypothetical protein
VSIVACTPGSEEQPIVAAPEPQQPLTVAFDWWAGDTPAGETVIVRAGDGRITNESFVHWNNREYRLDSKLQLDADGIVTAQTITGVSPFGATLDESFLLADGRASWRTAGETGSTSAESAAFYIPTEWGASASLEALVRAAAARPGGELPIYPSGAVRVTRQLQETVTTPEGEQALNLYAIHDLDFQPRFAWFDDELNLVARDGGRLGMIPRGWDTEVLQQLGRVQAAEEARLIESASARAAHRLDKPVVIENVDVVDVEQGRLLPARHILIANGLIREVSAEPIENDEAERIDGSGQTLIPGLWDMHSHHSLDDGVLNIAGGVTSVRNLGAVHERIMEQVGKFDSGQPQPGKQCRGSAGQD